MVAARAKGLFEAEAAARQIASRAKPGEKIGTHEKASADLRAPSGKAADHAAALANVAPRSVESASKVLAQGAPELVAAVDAGKVAVSAAAEVATLPPEEQRAALEAGAVPQRAKAIREGRKQARATPATPPAADPCEALAEAIEGHARGGCLPRGGGVSRWLCVLACRRVPPGCRRTQGGARDG